MQLLIQNLIITNHYKRALCLFIAVLSFTSGHARAMAPAAPSSQTPQAAEQKNRGCVSCHTTSDNKTMHVDPAVVLACVDCHGGDSSISRWAELPPPPPQYRAMIRQAHVLPALPTEWGYPSSANPLGSDTLLNRERPEYIRFVNPSDYRVARAACGACHLDTIKAAERSLMSTGAMLWGGAMYNNGILPFKNYRLGEAYSEHGQPATITGPPLENPDLMAKQHGILPIFYPLPPWEKTQAADALRVYERGGRNNTNLFPEIGLPNLAGVLPRIEQPGKPDIRLSNRGLGTGASIAAPLLDISKTRFGGPFMNFLGGNEHPGDYRSSGCAACHVIYANDRDKKHSGSYADVGHQGRSRTADPTISKQESGHPIQHRFSRAIPTSQCMVCHNRPANGALNSFLGYTLWDYESDAPAMWPARQVYATDKKIRQINASNPAGAAVRGRWSDRDFLANVTQLNPQLKDTQFADYHGQGGNFRAVYKRDRDGNLLDKDNNIVAHDDKDKFSKAVHMTSIHMEVGMHCVDCHFAQDNHGTGHLFAEVANAIEIDCIDCHGTADRYPNLKTSGPAAMVAGTDLSLLRNSDGRRRFEWVDDKLIQRSVLDPTLEWQLSLVKNSVNAGHPDYNEKAARAKLMSTNKNLFWGGDVPQDQRAHRNEDMECYTCHTAWTTSCGGCHLSMQANWKTARRHFEGGETRNYATYNTQVVRQDVFMLGRRGEINGGRIAPVRSSSALSLSAVNSNQEKIYIQQAPIAASGFSSQAFNPHFAHTVRKTETKTCSDCHLSKTGDNNAIMAQLLSYGTNFTNFVGYFAWVGGESSVEGVQVTEWEEPQAVIGSYLHRYAYPDGYQRHQTRDKELQTGFSHRAGRTHCIQMRGEYLYSANGPAGAQVYDIANIANKAFSERITTSPVGPWGQNTLIKSQDATCIALPTNQAIHPDRNRGELMRKTNQEQAFAPIYNYALITDAVEGLILVDVNTLADSEPRNNFLKRALTWNVDGILDGARHITLGGNTAYIIARVGLVILDLSRPLSPIVASVLPLKDGRASALQFRYLWVTDREGLKVVDVTRIDKPNLLQDNTIRFANANKVYLARTYAYVAAGQQGIGIVDIKRPEAMKLLESYTAQGRIIDAQDIVVATTNASLIAYVADGAGGLKVLQLTSPSSQVNFYGFSPAPKPEFIAWYPTASAALSLSKGLERDRAVDETGGQIAVFGRLGARPLSKADMQKMFLDGRGQAWFVEDE
ncbi:MAG: hypothetical protein ACC707_04635 [Thiohalomonadales bacterium]